MCTAAIDHEYMHIQYLSNNLWIRIVKVYTKYSTIIL